MVFEVCYDYNFTEGVYDEEALNQTILRSGVNGVNVGVHWGVVQLVERTQKRVDYWRKLGKRVSATIFSLPNDLSEENMRVICQLRNIKAFFIDCAGDYYVGLEDWINRFNQIAKENNLVFGIYHGDGLTGADKTKIDADIPILVENLYLNDYYLELPNPLWMIFFISEKDPQWGTTTGAYLKALYHTWEPTLSRIDAIWLFPAWMPNWELNNDQINGVKYWMKKLGLITDLASFLLNTLLVIAIILSVGRAYYLSRSK